MEYLPGSRVRIKLDWPEARGPAHIRTPHYVRGLAGVTGLVGLGARALHVGSLHAYVWWFFVGAVVLWGYAAGWFH